MAVDAQLDGARLDLIFAAYPDAAKVEAPDTAAVVDIFARPPSTHAAKSPTPVRRSERSTGSIDDSAGRVTSASGTSRKCCIVM